LVNAILQLLAQSGVCNARPILCRFDVPHQGQECFMTFVIQCAGVLHISIHGWLDLVDWTTHLHYVKVQKPLIGKNLAFLIFG